MALVLGGGVDVNGTSVINNSRIYDNYCNGAGVQGGGINTNQNLTIQKSQINYNRCNGTGGAQGGGIGASGNSVQIVVIENSQVNGNQCVESVLPTGSPAGGGIYIYGQYPAVLTIKNTQINNNSCTGAGNLSFEGGISIFGNLTIENSQVCKNNARRNGGIGHVGGGIGNLVMKNSHIDYNIATDYVGGANVNGNATITNSTIDHNSVSNGMIGGIYVDKGNLTMCNSSISHNETATTTAHISSYPMCGGIMIADGSLWAVDSHIDHNKSLWIGAMLVGIGTINLINSTVNNNTSEGSTDLFGCSAITNISGGIDVFRTTVKNNKTDGWFGSIVAFSDVNISESDISDNAAYGPGTVVELLDSSITVNRSKIIHNEGSAFGSGVASFSAVNPIVLTNSEVHKNILNNQQTIANMISKYQIIIANQTKGFISELSVNLHTISFFSGSGGEALYNLLNTGSNSVNNAVVAKQTALSAINLNPRLTNASGGIIGSLLACQINIFDSSLCDNNTVNTDQTNTTFGGAIFARSGKTRIEKSVIYNNGAINGGSALYTQGIASICDTTVEKNKTDNGSGTIYIDSSSTIGQLTTINALIKYNKVSNEGGGIYNAGFTNVIGTKIIENIAQSGGAIYYTIHPPTIIDSHIYKNVPDDIAH